MKLIDETGRQYARLTVLEKAPEPKLWLCRCSCGRLTKTTGSCLRGGSTKSCGCWMIERSAAMGSNPEFIAKRAEKAVHHGHKRGGRGSPEYRTWLGMKRRCSDPKFKDYANWGGRGIKVCDAWNHSFETFLRDMGMKPVGDFTIDRIDPNSDYGPGNCRWASRREQGALHRRGLREATVAGVSYPSMSAMCRSVGVPYTRTLMRLAAGHSLDEAVSATRTDLAKKRPRESYVRRSLRGPSAAGRDQ